MNISRRILKITEKWHVEIVTVVHFVLKNNHCFPVILWLCSLKVLNTEFRAFVLPPHGSQHGDGWAGGS